MKKLRGAGIFLIAVEILDDLSMSQDGIMIKAESTLYG